MNAFPLAVRLARRDLRGGVRALRLVLACLALGVAAIAAVGTLRAGLQAGLAADGARLLGGDLELRGGGQAPTAPVRDWLVQRGAKVSAVTSLRAMLVAASGERLLVEAKAVDGAYPLYGSLDLEPPIQLGPGEIALEPIIAERLHLSVGDHLRLGEAQVVFAARILGEPDKAATPALFGPRVLLTAWTLNETRLVQPGSLVQHALRARLPEAQDRTAVIAALRAAYASEGYRIRGANEAEPGLGRFLDRASAFLTLAGLTALLVGGIGVATGVRGWLAARARSIATLRCLGATSGLILQSYLLQIMALAGLGILVGLLLGFGMAFAAAQALAGSLPVPPRLVPYPLPLALAALYGFLTALVFGLWPLGRAAQIPGAALFRDLLQPVGRAPARSILLLNVGLAAALIALVIGTAGEPVFAMWFCAAAAVALIIFFGGAMALRHVARRLVHLRQPILRLGLANLYRPGAPTVLLVVSLGIGLTTLATIAQIEGNLRRELNDGLAARAPNFFFIDIQPDQAGRFETLATSLPGVTEVKRVPSLRARIVAVNGVPAEQVRATPETAWALRGDRGLTYAARPPEGTKLVAGQWWAPEYRGKPLLSFDAGLAKGWGIGLGDVITLNVLGRSVDMTIASLRAIDWQGLGMNFTLIASPGLLDSAPHSNIATVRGDPAQDGAVLRAVTDAFPNVSGIRVRDTLEAVASLLGRLGVALSAVAGITLLAGGLVLAGTIAADQRRRVRDAAILKIVGASRAQIGAAWAVEYALIGLVAGCLAAVLGTLAAWAVVTWVMRGAWVWLPGTLVATVLGCALLTIACGQIGTYLALRVRPGPLLRNE